MERSLNSIIHGLRVLTSARSQHGSLLPPEQQEMLGGAEVPADTDPGDHRGARCLSLPLLQSQ